jgi:hypothetical protein
MPKRDVLVAVLCDRVLRQLLRERMFCETHDLGRDVAVQVLMDRGVGEAFLMPIDLS